MALKVWENGPSEIGEQVVGSRFYIGKRRVDVLLADHSGVQFLADIVLDRELTLDRRRQRRTQRCDSRHRVAMRQALNAALCKTAFDGRWPVKELKYDRFFRGNVKIFRAIPLGPSKVLLTPL